MMHYLGYISDTTLSSEHFIPTSKKVVVNFPSFHYLKFTGMLVCHNQQHPQNGNVISCSDKIIPIQITIALPYKWTIIQY